LASIPTSIEISGRSLFPGCVDGEAIVSKKPFPLSGVTFDFNSGAIRWAGHELHGRSVQGKILVLPEIRAFAGGDWALFSLSTLYGTGPKAILCGDVGSFIAAGAILGRIPSICGLPEKFLRGIEDGMPLRVDSRAGFVHIGKSDACELEAKQLAWRISDRGGSREFTLTIEERSILDGSHGPAAKECLELLVQFGRAMGASRLVEIESVHAAGSGYNTTGEATTAYLNHLGDNGARVRVPATLNPIALDLARWENEMSMPGDLNANQLRLNSAFEQLGFSSIFSCAPYWTGHKPRRGSNIVWSEHNAVSFANSVVGARTNFESNIATVWAAVTGRIPYYGLYQTKNRKPSLRVEVKATLRDSVDWRCLGVAAARISENRIPIFCGLKYIPSSQHMRDLCASFGPPWTASPMLHVQGVTPEANEQSFMALDTVTIGDEEIQRVRDELGGDAEEVVDLVALGCPQYSLEEIRAVAERLQNKKIKEGVKLWVWTDATTRAEAEQAGYVKTIENAGAQVLSDTCGCAACPVHHSAFRFRNVITDSTKSCGFLSQTGLRTHLGSVDECVTAAELGLWPPPVLSA
jgi:predicted aconitase/predicted aconitase with swiveling domain